MKYSDSQDDKSLRKWFLNDNSKKLLRGVHISKGEIRGVTNLDINFNFPITAIAGRNGTGKSTILALVCCAFHNDKNGFKMPNRKQPYYTFVDFFIQHRDEISPQGLEIIYKISHNGWKKSENFPDGKGIGTQVRKNKRVVDGMIIQIEFQEM